MRSRPGIASLFASFMTRRVVTMGGEDAVRPQPLQSTLQAKLLLRLMSLSWFSIPVFLAYAACRMDGSSQLVHKSTLHVAAVTAPYVLALFIAAAMPEGIPPRASRYVAGLLSTMVASDSKYALDAWRQEEYPVEVRLLRTFVPVTWAVGVTAFICDLLHRRADRFWAGLQLVLVVCSMLRLAAVLALRSLEVAAEPGSFPRVLYPPGRMAFTTALWWNLGCVAFTTVGLLPACRRLLSRVSGLSCVTLTLSELSELPPTESGHWSPRIEGFPTPISRGSSASNLTLDSAGRPRQRQVRFGATGGRSAASMGSGASERSRVSVRSNRSLLSICSNQSGRSIRSNSRRKAMVERADRSAEAVLGEEGSRAPVMRIYPRHIRIQKRGRRQRLLTMYPQDFEAFFAEAGLDTHDERKGSPPEEAEHGTFHT